MLELFAMWLLVELLGLICLPLTTIIFHNLPDRGWAFSKAIGVTTLAFGVWFPLICLRFLPFNGLMVGLILGLLVTVNLFFFMKERQVLIKVTRANLWYILSCEVVFGGMVLLLGWIRSYAPEIRSYEMFMDEGFIAAIMRSPHLPPSDMWYAGFGINYYYYAHFVVAMLAKLLNQAPSVAFNTGISLYFGLTAVNLFGVTCNIVAWAQHHFSRNSDAEQNLLPMVEGFPPLLKAVPFGVFTMLLGLLMGNLASTQQWWKAHGDLASYDWFSPSRVIDKTINEFPAFSFLLSCFHAHVLALAFTIVGIALAFNLFLEPEGRGLAAYGRGWRRIVMLVFTALVLGGLFTMNGWDLPTYVGLTLVCLGLQQWLAYGSQWNRELLKNTVIAAVPLIVLCFLLYAPFYLTFISPSQGIGLVGPADRSPLPNELLIYGLFAFILVSVLLITLRSWLARRTDQPMGYGWIYFVGALMLLLLMSLVIGNGATFLVASVFAVCGIGAILTVFTHDRALAFTLLLGTLAFALVAVCEVFYLRDVFADNYPRMNTVFKFYFQAWALLSIASGTGLYFVWREFLFWFKRQMFVAIAFATFWPLILLSLLLLGAIYPVAGTYARTDRFLLRSNSLDGLAYMESLNPGDYRAIHWLNTQVSGNPVIVEAVGPDYSEYARVSAFTGLPTLMGWVGHEYQWRVTWLHRGSNTADFNSRSVDVESIYTSSDAKKVKDLLKAYQIQYIYVGPFENAKYSHITLAQFSQFLQVVYSADGVTIYKVR